MRDIFIRFLSANAINAHPMVYWGIGAVWLAMILNVFFSLRSQSLGVGTRWVWLLGVIFLPGVGMLAYLLWCLSRCDYSFLKFIFGPPNGGTVKAGKSAS